MDNTSVILTAGGRTKVRCLDIFSEDDDRTQLEDGNMVATTNTVLFGVCLVMGCAFAYDVTSQFQDERLQKWFDEFEHARKVKRERRAAEQAFKAVANERALSVETDDIELVRAGRV